MSALHRQRNIIFFVGKRELLCMCAVWLHRSWTHSYFSTNHHSWIASTAATAVQPEQNTNVLQIHGHPLFASVHGIGVGLHYLGEANLTHTRQLSSPKGTYRCSSIRKPERYSTKFAPRRAVTLLFTRTDYDAGCLTEKIQLKCTLAVVHFSWTQPRVPRDL